MSEKDQSDYRQIMEQLKSQAIPEEDRDRLLRELDDLFRKYEETES